jgi:iron-sulfur cluster assembly protein
MTVILTEKAAFRLRTFIKGSASATSETGIRVGVKDGGCSGYEYALDIAEGPNPDDLVFRQDNIPIYIDAKSESLVKGKELIYLLLVVLVLVQVALAGSKKVKSIKRIKFS